MLTDINIEQLASYLNGELSKSEEAEIVAWLNRSEENMKLAEQLYFVLQASNRVEIIRSTDSDAAYNRFRQILQKRKHHRRLQILVKYSERIAAILFIPLILLSAYLFVKSQPSDVQYIEVKTRPGMVSSVTLFDGTKVWLNAGGYLKYPSRFVAHNRIVELNGEAYFEVKKDPKHPFIVRTGSGYQARVLGTSFNISAYNDDDNIEATLVTGSIRLSITPKGQQGYLQVINPGEKAIYSKSGNTLHIREVNTEYDTAWKDGVIIFKNQPMNDVLKVLGRYYNVKFDVKDPEVWQSIMTGKFNGESLPQIMEYFRLACNIQYKINKPSIGSDDLVHMNTIEITK